MRYLYEWMEAHRPREREERRKDEKKLFLLLLNMYRETLK